MQAYNSFGIMINTNYKHHPKLATLAASVSSRGHIQDDTCNDDKN